jgi:hypothetical protein
MPSRWELLLDRKPISMLDHLLNEVAKLVAKDLETWPPPVTELDLLGTGRELAPLFEPDRPRPEPAVYAESFRVARWELEREVEAIDDYFRNRRYLERGLGEGDRIAVLFLSRYLTEQLLGLAEHTEGRVKRRQLIGVLEDVERRVRTAAGASPALAPR